MSSGQGVPKGRDRRWCRIACVLVVTSALAACGGAGSTAPSDGPDGLALSDVTAAQWQRLASRKVFFGHQSVGGNILGGVRAVLVDHPEISLRLVTSRTPAGVSGGALVDASVGSNGDPAGKIADFGTVLAGGLGPSGGVATYKFCYVDVGAGTDVAALLALHRARVSSIRAAHPEVTIVHMTMPLMTSAASGIDAEAKRVEYNRLLVDAYQGREPVFDLARVESTHADGSRSYVSRGTEQVFTLAEEWSADGGHLNAAGSRRVAEQLLIFLARL